MKTSSSNQTTHPLADSPHFVRITREQWEAEQAERYKFAFVPKDNTPRWQTNGRQ